MKVSIERIVLVALLVYGFSHAVVADAEYKILRTYTDKVAPVPLSKRVEVQCASSDVGGIEIEGSKVTFYYNAIDGEWCRASHACTKVLDKIAARSCRELKAVGN